MFSASTNAGSSQNTSRIIEPLLRWLFPRAPGETLLLVHLAIRKAAHVTEYAVFAVLLLRAVRHRTTESPLGWNWSQALAVIGLCAAVASADEFFQTFWDRRLGSPRDVALDTFGAALGISLRWLIRRRRGKW